MKLPGRENAYIASAKLTDYLLSEAHSVGRWKAQFFRGKGFNDTNVDDLHHGLLTIARNEEIKRIEQTRHGTKYVVEGPLQTPSGEVVQVRTVWSIDLGEARPRLVTAYPTE